MTQEEGKAVARNYPTVSVGVCGNLVVLSIDKSSAACTPRYARMFAMMLIEVADTIDYDEEHEDETPAP